MPKKPDAETLVHAAGHHPLMATAGMRRATLKELRKSADLTQEDLAAALCVGQDTISRLEKRSDMLLSTLRHYVESLQGELTLVASLPGQQPVIIDHLDEKTGKKRIRTGPDLDGP